MQNARMMKWILLIVPMILPFHLIGQNVILEMYENEKHLGDIGKDVSPILYSLEEGKKSPILGYEDKVTEDFELSEDSVKLWACKFRAFDEADFRLDDQLEFLSHTKIDLSKAYGTCEKLYLTIRDDESIEVKFSIKIIGYQGKIREIIMTDAMMLEGIAPEEVVSLYQKAQSAPKLEFPDLLPPPPPIPGEKEAEIRHQKAVEAFKCQ